MTIEQCIYAKFGEYTEDCIMDNCVGYNVNCPRYTTAERIANYRRRFWASRMLGRSDDESLEGGKLK